MKKIAILSLLIFALLSTIVFAWPTILTKEVQTCTDSDNGVTFWKPGYVYGTHLNGSPYGEDENGDKDSYPVLPDDNGDIPKYGLDPTGDSMPYYIGPNGDKFDHPHVDFCMSGELLAEWICYYDPIKQTTNIRLHEVNCASMGMVCYGHSHIAGRCF
jgi:hypothetical protein